YLLAPLPSHSTILPYTTLFRSMTETTIDEWDWWVVPYPWAYAHLNSDQWWNNLTLQAAVPVTLHFPPISQIDPASLYQLKPTQEDRKSTRLNSSHQIISYAVFC